MRIKMKIENPKNPCLTIKLTINEKEVSGVVVDLEIKNEVVRVEVWVGK